MEEKVLIPNKNSLRLAAVVHKPENNGFFPAVILLHGFMGYKEEEHIFELANDLAANGFVALRFAASGFGESEGTLEKDFRFSNYLSDTQAVYEYLKSPSFVNKENISIWDHSLGAMISVIFGAENKGIRKVVSVSAPYLFGIRGQSISKEAAKWKEHGWTERESSRFGKLRIPYEFLEDAEKYNVLDYAKRLNKPLLVILGKEDKNVLPGDTRKIYEEATEPKELFEVDNLDHFYKRHPELIKLVDDKIITFLKG